MGRDIHIIYRNVRDPGSQTLTPLFVVEGGLYLETLYSVSVVD